MQPIEYQIVAGAPRATVEDALRLFAALAPIFEQHGFMLALYGSTVRQQRAGADVDMLAVPGRITSLHEAQLCVSRLCCTMGFTQRGEPYAGLMGTYAVILQESNTGKILDIQFREVAPPAWQHFHGTVARATKEPQE